MAQEEEVLGKAYDSRLMKRLLQYLRPYKWPVGISLASILIKAVADGKQKMPSDPERKAVYQAQLARYEARKDKKEQAANPATATGDLVATPDTMTDEERDRRRQERSQSSWRQLKNFFEPPPPSLRHNSNPLCLRLVSGSRINAVLCSFVTHQKPGVSGLTIRSSRARFAASALAL